MARKTFLCLALLIGVLLSASPVLPCEKTLFGPRDFQVGRFFFHSSFQTFKVDETRMRSRRCLHTCIACPRCPGCRSMGR